jgi:hypothetical protein
VLRLADLVFGQLLPSVPAADRPSVESRYRALALAVERAATALRSGLAAAEQGQRTATDPTHNLAPLRAALLTAANDLRAFLASLGSVSGPLVGAGPRGSSVAGADELDAVIRNLSQEAPR